MRPLDHIRHGCMARSSPWLCGLLKRELFSARCGCAASSVVIVGGMCGCGNFGSLVVSALVGIVAALGNEGSWLYMFAPCFVSNFTFSCRAMYPFISVLLASLFVPCISTAYILFSSYLAQLHSLPTIIVRVVPVVGHV